jgi:hypothetical protein
VCIAWQLAAEAMRIHPSLSRLSTHLQDPVRAAEEPGEAQRKHVVRCEALHDLQQRRAGCQQGLSDVLGMRMTCCSDTAALDMLLCR